MLQIKSYFHGEKYLALIYTILVTIFSLIIQVSLIRMFLYLSLGGLDYLVLIGVSFLYLELLSRGVKQGKIAVILAIVGGILINTIHGGEFIYRYLVMVILHIGILIINIPIQVASEDIKEHSRNMIIFIVISALGFIDSNHSYFYTVGQLCIMFFIMYIYILRILREFSYGLRKENRKQNIVYIILIVLLLIDSTQRVFVMVAKLCIGVISFILGEFLGMLGYTIGPILSNLKISPKNAGIFGEAMTRLGESAQKMSNSSKYTAFSWEIGLVTILEVVSALIFIFILYVITKEIWGSVHSESTNEGIRIEREEIKKISKMKNKEKIKQPVTIKEKILYNYREFLIKAKNKKIYKDYMTGRQVQSRVGTEVCQVQEELKIMTSIYNEVKFSNHDVDEKKLKDFKDNYDKVKKVF